MAATKWEYKHVNVREEINYEILKSSNNEEDLYKSYVNDIDRILNKYGDDNWELFSIDYSSGWMLLKRIKNSDDQFNMPTVPDDPVHQVTQ